MQIVALFGPTGVGKTAIAVALARRLRARGEDPVAVSADAMQVYAGLETLTGVASAEQQAQLEHRLVSFVPLASTFSAGRYAQLAHAEIDQLLAAGRRPLVVGGTGLYLRAALTDLDMKPPPAQGVRERWRAQLDAHGAPALHGVLAERAPGLAAGIDPHDRQRIARALELLELGVRTPADAESQLWSEEMRRRDAADRPDDGARGAVRADRRARGDDGRVGSRARGQTRRRGGGIDDRAQGGRVR